VLDETSRLAPLAGTWRVLLVDLPGHGLGDKPEIRHTIALFALFSSFWKPERVMDIFKKYLPRLEYEVMTGVGHYPMLEKPAQTNAFLTRVLARL
jgi:pimeloyl-ACP methyl ester carboxylesterase